MEKSRHNNLINIVVLNATPKSCLVSQVVFLILAVGVCCLTGSGIQLWQVE